LSDSIVEIIIAALLITRKKKKKKKDRYIYVYINRIEHGVCVCVYVCIYAWRVVGKFHREGSSAWTLLRGATSLKARPPIRG
jgi:hypothetical protein